MQVAQQIKTLLSIIVHIFFSSADTWATQPSNALVKDNNRFIQTDRTEVLPSIHQSNATLSLPNDPAAQDQEVDLPKIDLPLVKVAHPSSMELLHLFFIPKTIQIPIYTPFLHHLGLQFNWLGCIHGLCNPKHQTYAGGMSLHLRNKIQLFIELGYGNDSPTTKKDQLQYAARGWYQLIALLYVAHPNPLTNAHIGIAYGTGQFHLALPHKDESSAACKPYTAHWVKIILSSEVRLIPNSGLYGGIQFGIARLLKCNTKHNHPTLHYKIPGYGTILNKKMSIQIIPYLKWNISFLEKKITS